MSEEIFAGSYLSIFSDGTIGYSDGSGYVGSSDDLESRKILHVLFSLYYPDLAKRLLELDTIKTKACLLDVYSDGGEYEDLLECLEEEFKLIEDLQSRLGKDTNGEEN